MRPSRSRRVSVGVALAALALAAVPSAVVASPSCTAQFVSVASKVARPLGQNIVVVEVRQLTLGGPNLGQEVKLLFATADRNACPVPPVP